MTYTRYRSYVEMSGLSIWIYCRLLHPLSLSYTWKISLVDLRGALSRGHGTLSLVTTRTRRKIAIRRILTRKTSSSQALRNLPATATLTLTQAIPLHPDPRRTRTPLLNHHAAVAGVLGGNAATAVKVEAGAIAQRQGDDVWEPHALPP